jgi:hypothetical protein
VDSSHLSLRVDTVSKGLDSNLGVSCLISSISISGTSAILGVEALVPSSDQASCSTTVALAISA